jgi:hypothetical protein
MVAYETNFIKRRPSESQDTAVQKEMSKLLSIQQGKVDVSLYPV